MNPEQAGETLVVQVTTHRSQGYPPVYTVFVASGAKQVTVSSVSLKSALGAATLSVMAIEDESEQWLMYRPGATPSRPPEDL